MTATGPGHSSLRHPRADNGMEITTMAKVQPGPHNGKPMRVLGATDP